MSADTQAVKGSGSNPALTLPVCRELSRMEGSQERAAPTSFSRLIEAWKPLIKDILRWTISQG